MSKPVAVWRYVNIFVTFHFVALGWIFFRAPSFEIATQILERITSLTVSFANVSGPLWVILGIAIFSHYLPKKLYETLMNSYARAPFYAQAAALLALLVSLQYVVSTGAAPFIYTNF